MASFLKAPFFPILLFYCAGLLFPPNLFLNLFLLVLFLTTVLFLIKKYKTGIWISLALFSFFLFGQIIQGRSELPSEPHHIYYALHKPKKVELTGLVTSSPERFDKKVRIYVEIEKFLSEDKWREATGLLRLDLYGDVPDLKYGDRIKIAKAKLSRPGNFKNPGSFDYVRYLKNRGIYATGWAGKNSIIKVLEQNRGNGFFSLVHHARTRMEAFADETMPYRNASLFKAMVFGKKSGLSQKDADLFIETGIAHLTAVSGLHIGFVAFFSYFVLDWAGLRFLIRIFPRAALGGWSSRLAAIGTLFPVIFYALIVGERVSSIRAAIMAVFFLLSIAVKRGSFHYYTLATAALAILIWKPGSLFDAGFQLSFSAVFFILFLFSHWLKFKEEAYSPLTASRFEEFAIKYKRLSGYLFVTLFASVGAFPLIAFHFNHFTPLSFLLNLVAVPLATLIVTCGLFLSFLSLFFYELATFFAVVPELSIILLARITEWFSLIPFGSIRLSTPSPGLVIAFYLTVIAVSSFKKNFKKSFPILLSSLLAVPFFPGIEAHYPKGELSVTFLDVGQGDASILRFPNGKTMLVDGGRSFGNMDIGKWVVGPLLWDMGITKVDYVVASHPDNDHIGGLLFIIREFDVGEIIENGEMSDSIIWKEIRREANSKKIPLRTLHTGDILKVDKVNIEIFRPGENFAISGKRGHSSDNNLSLVLRAVCGGVSILFTGDIEYETERALTESGMDIRSTILKVPHHGSGTSSSMDFINSVKPEVAVISAGSYNRFGHPKTEVLKRYHKAGAKVMTTNRCGAVEVFSDCKTYRVETVTHCGS